MKLRHCLNLLILGCSLVAMGQVVRVDSHQVAVQQATTADALVPLVIRFGSRLQDADGKPIIGTIGVTFALYADRSTEVSLWRETQNLTLDQQGRFTVLLGASSPTGIPVDIFASGEARWLGVSTDDGLERPRTLLASVPYALEAADAQTVGGKHPDEFLTAAQFHSLMQAPDFVFACSGLNGYPCHLLPPERVAISPTFEAISPIGPSFISDATSGAPFAVKSSDMVPNLNADLLHGLTAQDFVQSKMSNQFSAQQLFNGGISLEGATPTTTTTSQVSPVLDFKDRVYDASSSSLQDRRFRLQSEPASDAQGTPDRLSFLYGVGTNAPIETGLSINPDGTINFASAQQFPIAPISVPPPGSYPVSISTSYQWNQVVSSAGIVAGANTITLAQCPPGVNASDPSLYVYISGTGAPEAVHVTGGTCKGDGQPGTLQFVAANNHPTGYTVSSASGGIQEAILAGAKTTNSGNIIVPPGEYAAYAPISIRQTDVTIDFSGATIDCYVSNTSCIFVGDPKNTNNTNNVTLLSPRGKPMVPYGTNAFIEDNAQQTRLQNVSTIYSPQPNSFGTLVQVDNDQSFLLDGLNALNQGLRCDPTFCGSYVTAPGPFSTRSAVGWLKNLNLSLQCNGSGVDWQSGNSLKITDSVIQGWSLFAVRVGHKRGGFGGFISDNVYYEASPSCIPYDPLGNVGLAGIINQGGEVSIRGVAMDGASGVFPNWGASSGSQKWLYWVVPVHATYGDGVPLPAGYAWTSGPTTITGTFPRIAGAASYKILKMVFDGNSMPPYPEGTGNYLLTTIQQTTCGVQVCQFTDNGQTLSLYSNAGENFTSNIYLPMLDFWPGAIIMSQASDLSTASGSIFSPQLTADILGEGAVVSTLPANLITGQAQTMIPTATPVPSASGISAMNTGATLLPGATILKAFNSSFQPSSGFKGRLNLGDQGRAGGFSPLITLGDSNWGKTWATPNERPTADVGDLDIGYEGAIDTYYQRATHEIRNYIGKFPDGQPQESLTGATKTFNVPVVINGNLIVKGTCTGCSSAAQQHSTIGAPSSEEAKENLRAVYDDNTRTKRSLPSNSVSQLGLSKSITSAQLCAAAKCGPGLYIVNYYMDSSSSCSRSGSATVILTINWADETSPKSIQVPLSGTGTAEDKHLLLGDRAHFGSGQISLWSAGVAPISYSTSYTGCASGNASYSLRIGLRELP